jgi:hypothetical protein
MPCTIAGKNCRPSPSGVALRVRFFLETTLKRYTARALQKQRS